MNDKEKEIQLLTNETFLEIMKHQREQVNNFKKVCIACLVTLCIIAITLCGSIIYFFSTYEVEVLDTTTTTYEQSSDGESQIINGNNYNDNSIHNDDKEE